MANDFGYWLTVAGICVLFYLLACMLSGGITKFALSFLPASRRNRLHFTVEPIMDKVFMFLVFASEWWMSYYLQFTVWKVMVVCAVAFCMIWAYLFRKDRKG